MVGEVQVRGENVCLGYYKNPQATADLFTEDGWMRTGDLGYIEQDTIFLRGRSKAMLLGSNGQNIYPEENDAILVQRDKRLVALLSVDRVALEKDGYATEEAIKAFLDDQRKQVNTQIASYAQIAAMEMIEGEFEKTPKQSIKRYLYQ